MLLIAFIAIAVAGFILVAASVLFGGPIFKLLSFRSCKFIFLYKYIILVEGLGFHCSRTPVGIIFHCIEIVFGVTAAHVQHNLSLNISCCIVIECHFLGYSVDTGGNCSVICNNLFSRLGNGIHFISICEIVTGFPIIESVSVLDFRRHIDIGILGDIHGMGLVPGSPFISVHFVVICVMYVQLIAGIPRVYSS